LSTYLGSSAQHQSTDNPQPPPAGSPTTCGTPPHPRQYHRPRPSICATAAASRKTAAIVAGATVELTLELPRSTSSATGTLHDRTVAVTWSLSDNSTGNPELPATLQGTVGDKQVNLRGLFRLTPSYWFDGASIEGTLDDAELAASVEPASGANGTTDTVVATGTFGNGRFEVFAAVDGSLEHGRVRGTYDGQPIHLDLTSTHGAEAHVTGG
jgi:hypothetical protein